jgi:hypothetical protein
MSLEHPYDYQLPPAAPDETPPWSDTLTATPTKPAGQIIYAYHRFARSASETLPADTITAASVDSSPLFDDTATRRKSDQRDLLMFPSQARTRHLPDWRAQAESLSTQRLEQESPVTEQGPPHR